MTARNLLLLGAPGAGKGTQAVRLAARLGVPHVSTGDLLRAAVAAGTPLGLEARRYMDRGELVPDGIVIGVAAERLARPDAKTGFVLDGFPRTVAQAEALDAELTRLGAKLDRCLALVTDEAALVARLLKRAQIEGRTDDNEATIRHRMKVYRSQTEPLIACYQRKGVLREIDGMGTIEEVERRIQKELGA
ncbi:MAG TPA: adenylate kinase [Myxococcota bacterium]|jgi:adenylate kinase